MNDKINIIYILGTSYSGSSLLGYILTSDKNIFNAGELKFYTRLKKNGGEMCSCGKNCLTCDFWKPIFKKDYNIYSNPNIFYKIRTSLEIFLNFNFKKDKKINDDFKLLKYINKNTNSDYIIDTSKSLWRLIYLLNTKDINLKIIYLYRNIEGNVSSFKKHNYNFHIGLFIYLLNNYLIKKFLKKNFKNEVLYLNYDSLCKDKKEFDKINLFINKNFNNYVLNLRTKKTHIPSENLYTRKQFNINFNGLKYDESWIFRLNNYEKKIISLFK